MLGRGMLVLLWAVTFNQGFSLSKMRMSGLFPYMYKASSAMVDTAKVHAYLAKLRDDVKVTIDVTQCDSGGKRDIH